VLKRFQELSLRSLSSCHQVNFSASWCGSNTPTWGRCFISQNLPGRSCAHPDRLGDCIPCNSQPTRSWPGGTMDNHCPYCGISVAGQSRCPLCDTRLASVGVGVSLRRALLWAFVVEEFVLLMVLRRLA
jgi:hypothetical protein